MNNQIFTKFEGRVIAEGAFSSDTKIFNPKSLLELALQYALVSMLPDEVSKLVADVSERMLHSLSCKRRREDEVVRVDQEGDTGLYLISTGRGGPEECVSCGNPLCKEWPTLVELSAEGAATGEFAYHVSECQMQDPGEQDKAALEMIGRSVLTSIRAAMNPNDAAAQLHTEGGREFLLFDDEFK
ncbi:MULTISPECIES: hypothetical protein [Pseudomonas]|jgi:hypothetical protein|uniref:hypothetical protein n=1 Tax=Pseudomonas TaxID=286 RepID=UPI0018E87349|nr:MULTISPECIES: hypothetical protein [Pseudomonas]MBJ2286656.1 hypothetical protein [Pseudomonas sp. MF6755]MDH0796193.1 hypothetical protein [Pseudomonas carnis]